MTADLQARIDAMVYPPTHTYRLRPPGPTGVLAERWGLLESFFRLAKAGERFLDVGCSKGWFSLAAQALGFQAEALDTDPAAVALCRDLGIDARHGSFREWPPPEHRFGLVFVGNVNHYCYQEAGWAWVKKLAAVTEGGGTVIIEGPVGTECADVRTMTPAMTEAQLAEFSGPVFRAEMAPYFQLIHNTPTVAYTPDRYITVWRRRDTPAWLNAPFSGSAVIARNKPNGSTISMLGDRIIKRYDASTPGPRRSVEFACMSSYATHRLADIIDGGQWRGWVEEYVGPDDPQLANTWKVRQELYPGELGHERRAFAAACRHNAELARMGMVDVDMGPSNWRLTPAGWLTVDKNAVWPIATLPDEEVDPARGRFMRTLDWACHPRAVPPALRAKLARALATRNSVMVERAFLAVAEEVSG